MHTPFQMNIRELADLTGLVRGELSSLHRKILAALITVDVHARDIVTDLHKHKVKDINDFDWQMQLRYYFENEDVAVRQVGRASCGVCCVAERTHGSVCCVSC